MWALMVASTNTDYVSPIQSQVGKVLALQNVMKGMHRFRATSPINDALAKHVALSEKHFAKVFPITTRHGITSGTRLILRNASSLFMLWAASRGPNSQE